MGSAPELFTPAIAAREALLPLGNGLGNTETSSCPCAAGTQSKLDLLLLHAKQSIDSTWHHFLVLFHTEDVHVFPFLHVSVVFYIAWCFLGENNTRTYEKYPQTQCVNQYYAQINPDLPVHNANLIFLSPYNFDLQA